ncbi:MAG TPA: cupin domain-containing protein, partial [Gaiellales bacterium]
MSGIAHWDEVEGVHRSAGHLDAEWLDLGSAAGSQTVGLQLNRIAPGGWSTPAHIEHSEEEIFWVLRGSGVSWQDAGAGTETYAVAAGDCLVHPVRGAAHTLHAGDDGLDVLAFGERGLGGGAYLPRAGLSWHGPSWVRSGGEPSPWQGEARAGAPELVTASPRPGSIVHIDGVAGKRRE